MKRIRRKRKRRFKMLVWLFLVAILLGTSSYAWFTTNRMVYINSLNVKVKAEGGISISADGKDFKSILTIEDLINAHLDVYKTSTNQIPDRLEPVSTGKTIDKTNGFLNLYYGQVDTMSDGTFSLAATKSVEEEGSGESSNGKFIAFDIFLKTQSPTDLYLTQDSGAVYEGEESVGIENAVRMAFLVQGTTEETSSLGTIQGLKGATEDTSYIWEPNYNTHTQSGVDNAKNVYGIETSLIDTKALNYEGIISEINRNQNVTIDKANSTNFPNLFKKVTVDYKTETNFNQNQQVFDLPSGITKVRVYMWIEGQDVDCENDASVGNITFTLQFTSNRS